MNMHASELVSYQEHKARQKRLWGSPKQAPKLLAAPVEAPKAVFPAGVTVITTKKEN